jgi:transposase InsO family protein
VEFGVRWLLRQFRMYPNAYYNYRKHRKQVYQERKQVIDKQIVSIFHEYGGKPGYRMMRIFLIRKGICLSKTTVHKYMKALKLKAITTPKRPRYVKGDCYKKYDNLLNQAFAVDAPNTKWCTDFTYLYLADGSVRYNCSIVDLYDRYVVASLNSTRINAQLAIDTLELAFANHTVKDGLILHSDQGSQYTSFAFTESCREKQICQSMSKAGCPYDNAPMESYFGTFKNELIKQHTFMDDDALNEATFNYVQKWYNPVRPHSANHGLTPFEKRYGT